jgi:hypothetical protein
VPPHSVFRWLIFILWEKEIRKRIMKGLRKIWAIPSEYTKNLSDKRRLIHGIGRRKAYACLFFS